MNFSSMEYFTILAQERNFTRAAERLHITQQSLSAHIAGLEKELSCQLVIRRVPLSLTYAGEVLLRYADAFQKAHSDMQREFCDISQEQKGILRVGAAAARGRMILPRAISQFQKCCPNIRVELMEASNDALHQALLKGRIDLAIADFSGTPPGIKLRDFYREETVLLIEKGLFSGTFGPKAESAEKQLLAGDHTVLMECPFVLGSTEDIDGQIGRSILQQAGITDPVIRAASHNVGMLLQLCLRGIGACFCPKNIVLSELTPQQMGSLLIFGLGEEAVYPIRFWYQDKSYQWSVIERFMECAESAAS